ncbi:MAG: adenylyl-sulfate kinase [Acidimicrobiales bacterium]|nr:adenylyl-sulfate kinase [Acidimicrobiales bacterium]
MSDKQVQSPNVVWHKGAIDRAARWRAHRLGGATVWFTGLSGSGKSSIAVEVERILLERGRAAYLLDGDNLRHGLNGDLGFSPEDRHENVRRAAEVARLFADAGIVALVPLISPYRSGRQRARELHVAAGLPFFEIYVDTPIEECERRDPKGLYARARAGEISGFTGVDDPYEPPDSPDLVLRPQDGPPETQAQGVIELIEAS